MRVAGSDLVAQALQRQGVDTFFYLMGAPMLSVEAAALALGMRGIDVRHEQAAAMAAHAYARLRNRPGVCMAASGPGTANLVTGVAHAWADGTPVLALGGSAPGGESGRGAFQELDQLAMMAPCTKWAERVHHAERIPELIDPIIRGERHLMLGSRFLGDPLAGGMPRWKYIANRFLTGVENLAFGLHLSEYHTGLRAYSRRLLETIPYQANSDDFVFDQELIAQVVAAGMAGRIGEVAVPTRYFEEASSVGFRRSVVYGLSTLRVVARYLLHRMRVRRSRKLAARRGPD